MILTVSITLLSSVFLCQNTASEILNLLNTSLECEHVVIGADPAALQHIKDGYSPLSLCELSIHTDAELGDGFVTVAISAYGDYRDIISPEVLPEKLPEGKAVALTRSLARLCRVSVGDRVPLRLNGNVYELTVSEVFDSKSLAVFFDAKALGLRTDICGFDLPDSVNTEENLSRLKGELELNGSSLERASVIFERIYKTGAAFTTIVRGAFFLSTVLTAAACMNSIFSGYRRRRLEFRILRLSGMTKRRMDARIACELLCVLLFSCVFALPLCAIAFTALELGAASFGLTLF